MLNMVYKYLPPPILYVSCDGIAYPSIDSKEPCVPQESFTSQVGNEASLSTSLQETVNKLRRGVSRRNKTKSVIYNKHTSEHYSWLPEGWEVEERERDSGHVDIFYCSPGKRCRSRTEAVEWMKKSGFVIDESQLKNKKRKRAPKQNGNSTSTIGHSENSHNVLERGTEHQEI